MGHVPFFVQVGMTDVFFWAHALRAYCAGPPPAGHARHQGHSGGRRPAPAGVQAQPQSRRRPRARALRRARARGPCPPGRARRASSSSVRLSQSRRRRQQQLRLRQMCAAPNAPRAPARVRHLFFLLASEPTHPCSLLAVRLTRAVRSELDAGAQAGGGTAVAAATSSRQEASTGGSWCWPTNSPSPARAGR